MLVMFRFTLLLAVVASMALPASAGLRAGVAKTDITPTTHEVMWGFESRLEPAESTLDPLYARVLVLETGGQRLAIVALDLGRSFGEASLDRLRESARKSSGITCMLVTASHTHSAPIIKDEYTGAPPTWEQRASIVLAPPLPKPPPIWWMPESAPGPALFTSAIIAFRCVRTEPSDGSNAIQPCCRLRLSIPP